MASNWREIVVELLPGWMTEEGSVWQKWTGLPAIMMDALTQGANEALFAPWLAEPTSPDDVLPYVASERRMQRYPGETAAQHRARLLGAWDAWELAGNESAIVSQLELFGLSDIEIITARDWDWDSLAPSPATWAEGVGGAANWSRFWVVIKGHPWTQDTSLDGFNATPEQVRTLRAIIQQWKSAEALNPWIVIVFDPTTWAAEQPDGTWYDHRNRSRSAFYIDGKGQRPVLHP